MKPGLDVAVDSRGGKVSVSSHQQRLLIHFIAKRINNAIQEIKDKLKEVAEIQAMVLVEVSQENFGLDKSILQVVIAHCCSFNIFK